MKEKQRKKYKDLTESQKQNINGYLVEKEVLCCVSSICDYILKKSWEDRDTPFSYEDIENNFYFNLEDWKDNTIDLIKDCNTMEEDEKKTSLKELEEVNDLEEAQDFYNEYCEAEDPDDYKEDSEIYEYWAVTSWFYDKLINESEAGIEKEAIWCRCTTGQAIKIDGVLYKIASDLWDEGFYFNDSSYDESYFKDGAK